MTTERLTNDYLKFVAEIAIELKKPVQETATYKPRFIYTELPFIHVNSFAIHYLSGNIDKLLLRRWNWQFDIQKGQLGVWNLDRVAISEKSIELKEGESSIINALLLKPFTIKPLKNIVLDSTAYGLTLLNNGEQTYEWKTDNQLAFEAINLFNYLKELIGVVKLIEY